MRYTRISADCHIDMPWLPPDLFTANGLGAHEGPHALRHGRARRTAVDDQKGAPFGLVGGIGSTGTKYVPGQNHRVDVMASTGLYDDGKKGIRRPATRTCASRTWTGTAFRPRCSRHPRGRDAARRPRGGRRDVPDLQRLARRVLQALPERHVGLACLPYGNLDAAVKEVYRVARLGLRASSSRAPGTWSPCGIRSGSRSGRPSTT